MKKCCNLTIHIRGPHYSAGSIRIKMASTLQWQRHIMYQDSCVKYDFTCLKTKSLLYQNSLWISSRCTISSLKCFFKFGEVRKLLVCLFSWKVDNVTWVPYHFVDLRELGHVHVLFLNPRDLESEVWAISHWTAVDLQDTLQIQSSTSTHQIVSVFYMYAISIIKTYLPKLILF